MNFYNTIRHIDLDEILLYEASSLAHVINSKPYEKNECTFTGTVFNNTFIYDRVNKHGFTYYELMRAMTKFSKVSFTESIHSNIELIKLYMKQHENESTFYKVPKKGDKDLFITELDGLILIFILELEFMADEIINNDYFYCTNHSDIEPKSNYGGQVGTMTYCMSCKEKDKDFQVLYNRSKVSGYYN